MTKPATIEIDREEAYEWLVKGAQPTDTVRAILRFKGVLYRKHLMRGVQKGSLTQEQADVKWQEWIDTKESKVSARRDAVAAEIAQMHAERFGTKPAAPVAPVVEIPSIVEAVAEEAHEAVAEVAEEVVAEAAAEAPATEEAPAAEEEKTEE